MDRAPGLAEADHEERVPDRLESVLRFEHVVQDPDQLRAESDTLREEAERNASRFEQAAEQSRELTPHSSARAPAAPPPPPPQASPAMRNTSLRCLPRA